MRRVIDHILFWCGYVFFKAYLNISADWATLLPESTVAIEKYVLIFTIQLVMLTIKLPLVYGCFYLLNRYLNGLWKIGTTILALIGFFALAVVLMSMLNHFFILPYLIHYTGQTESVFNFSSLLYHFFTLAFVTGAASSLKLLRKQYQSRLREIELQKAKVAAELKYLKGQINPHFLFNTLNNIYSLARKNSAQTAEAVMKLSKLMRFMLYEVNSSTLSLSQELKLIDDYIALEKLRYSDRLQVNFITEVDNAEQQIAPLLLIHFVENAFKHGAGESRFESIISIHIKLVNKVLSAHISNSKENLLQPDQDRRIGLDNIKRQLELLYPTHLLSIADTKTTFTVELTIPLD